MKNLTFLFLIIVVVVSCKTKQSLTDSNAETLGSLSDISVWDYICLENLQNSSPLGNKSVIQKPGIIRIKLSVDSIYINNQAIKVDTVYYFKLDQESDLLMFGGKYAIKLFHIDPIEYGNVRHQIRQDLFVFESNCWKRKLSLGYSNLNFTDPQTSSSFSTGYPDSRDYIKLSYRVLGNY